MVSCYGQANFGWKYMFFQLLLKITLNLMAKIMQNAYLCDISLVEHKKIPFLAVWTWFLILGKIQEDQRLSTKGKIVSKYCNISKPPGRSSIHPLPPCTTVGIWICVYVRLLSCFTLSTFNYMFQVEASRTQSTGTRNLGESAKENVKTRH